MAIQPFDGASPVLPNAAEARSITFYQAFQALVERGQAGRMNVGHASRRTVEIIKRRLCPNYLVDTLAFSGSALLLAGIMPKNAVASLSQVVAPEAHSVTSN